MASAKASPHPSTPFETLGSADHAVVFVHGFLDAGEIWGEVIVAGEAPSRLEGPVLILHGEDDPFVNAALVGMSTPRFRSAAAIAVPAAGHWPQVEQPRAVAARLDEFLKGVDWHPSLGAGSPQGSRAGESTVTRTGEVQQQAWTEAFAKKSASAFAEAFAEDVVLEATTLTAAVHGRASIKIILEAASKIYESLVFTEDAAHGPRRYLEWKATAFGGEDLAGVTILTNNDAGEITHVAIHHRPLQGALRFSAELGRRLEGRIGRGYFHTP